MSSNKAYLHILRMETESGIPKVGSVIDVAVDACQEQKRAKTTFYNSRDQSTRANHVIPT